MIRLLNVLALIAVISSATWAYSVKYETILVAEKLRKREAELTRERDAVAILQAEWHLLNRPERMQSLAKPEAGMQSVSARQVARPVDIPQATPDKGDKIDALLTGSIPTPDLSRKTPAKTAGTTPKSGTSAKAVPGKATTSKTTTSKTTTAKAATPPLKTTAAKTPAKGESQTAARATPKAGNQPLRIVPPAKVGASPKAAPAASVAAAPTSEKSSGGLTGFLKNLVR